MSLVAEEARVRAGTADDLATVAEIFAHYVLRSVATFEETPPSVRDWQGKFDAATEHRLPFLVAEADRRVVGYAYASPWRPKPAYRHTVEDSVYLSPDWTGRGLGRLLLAELIARSQRAGARQMVAVIADSGDPASATLHRRLGFADAGRLARVGFKHGRWIDTLLLQRDLTEESEASRAF
jgi:L-amino acid N-acyltransferase YncA